MSIYIGIDNGISGSVAIIRNGVAHQYVKTPIVKCLDYTKKKKFLHRIEGGLLKNLLQIKLEVPEDKFCMIERPMINPMRWNASVSAIRAMEATLIILEGLQIPYQFVDSKEWQKALLPKGLEKEELKFASLQVGKRLFPHLDFSKHRDADGLLIAEFARRTCERLVSVE